MKINGQRKATIGILALALGALAVDRLYLGGVGPAVASASAPVVESDSPVIAAAALAPAVPTLAARLEMLAATESLDPSAVTDLFGVNREVPWRVTGIVGIGMRGSVVVDGRSVGVGETYDGAVLVRIHRAGAVFERDGREFDVQLQTRESEPAR